MKIIHFFTIFHILLVTLLAQETVREIKIYGNKNFSELEILNLMKTKVDQNYIPSVLKEDLKKILEYYHNSGYYSAQIDSFGVLFNNDSSEVDIALYITENVHTVVGEIYISGNKLLGKEEIIQNFDTRTGKVFSPQVFEKDISEILKMYGEKGYPFVKVSIDSIWMGKMKDEGGRMKDEKINIRITLDEGNLSAIDEVVIKGNSSTKDYVIKRESGIKEGEKYDERKVNLIKRRLERLGYFNDVKTPQIFFNSKNEMGLLIEVEEGNPNSFNGVVGYLPGNGKNESGYFTGLIDLSFKNILGTGRQIDAKWEKRDRLTQDFKIRYVEPWILSSKYIRFLLSKIGLQKLGDYPVHLGLEFNQLVQDTIYVKSSYGFDVTVPITENFGVFTRFYTEDVTPDSSLSFVYNIPQSKSYYVSLGFNYDTRNDRINPRSGFYLKNSFEFGSRENLGPEGLIGNDGFKRASDTRKTTLETEYIFEVFNRQTVSLKVNGGEVSGSDFIPFSDRFRLGGAKTLRGYREGQFNGTRIIWTNTEYRFTLARRTFVFLFFDYGYYYRKEIRMKDEGGIKSEKIMQDAKLFGYGVGLRLSTRLGIMGVDFGLGRGDTFLDGKIHVGLSGEF